MGAPAKDGDLRWDEPAKTPPARRPVQPAPGPLTPGRQPPAAEPPARAPAPAKPSARAPPPAPAQTPARAPATAKPPAQPPARAPATAATPARAPAPAQAPYSPHGYVPPSYQPQPQTRRPDKFSSTLEQWQTNRESVPTRDEHEMELRRSLERAPGPGPEQAVAPQPRPSPAPASRIAPPHSFETPAPRPYKKSRLPVIRSVAIVVIVVILLGVLQAGGQMGQFRDFLDRDLSKGLPVLRSYPVSAEFKLNRVMSSTCRGPEMTYTVYIGIPMNIPGQQEIVQISPNPAPTTQNGNFWTWSGTVTTGQKASVVIGYQVKATLYRWSLDASKSGTVSQIPAGYAKYLGAEWKFAPNDATISKLAADLAGGTNNTFEKVQRIYSYIHDNIAYQTNSPAEPKDPTQTLSEKAGDCDDQSFLLGSLLRAQGIPAWLEMGLLYDQTQRAWGGHAWLRTYIPSASGAGHEVQIDPANDEFLFRDSFRLTDYIDDGNGDHLENYYISWRYVYSGAPPLREDRYDAIFYRPSDATVEIATTGPGPGAQALGQIWKMPGFESGLVILAMAASVVFIGAKKRKAFGA
jgi:transglutaminase-like putative cysteine protease